VVENIDRGHLPALPHLSFSPRFAVSAQPGRVGCIVERAARKTENSLSGILLGSHKYEAVELQENDADDKTSRLVTIHEGVVADDTRRIERRHLNHIRMLNTGMMLAGPSQSRLQKPLIAQSRAASVGG